MSKINNSLEYYQSNQSLLSMLNKGKTGNPLINQLISKNEAAYQKKMESLGLTGGKSNAKYKNVDTAATNLVDAIEKLGKKELYTAEEGKEYDKTNLLKSVNNFVTAYNSTISNLSSCGGALNNSFKTEFEEAFKEKRAEFEKLGISMTIDKKLELNQEKLETAAVMDIQKLLGTDSNYMKNISSSADSINTIIGKALSLGSSNYTSKGVTLF
ncbi:hypothetical protein SAMN02910298_00608 [Pseudobutyrivibrio sp. YE44]|uniref:hypothetical protein n=1 Tax=Pseudobutyrivibrio sp. YE44 TaxID=1520802 RepID=UPI00088594FB|nr:hypothetical protein [Pseudobutyrivibrio sp. YE44]SDB12008.1 hypothetical protein SAMN02910298_00608 [Pseudobutyrivibrio sp. YE44]